MKNIEVIDHGDNINSVWVGGSILGSMTNYSAMYISKEEYEDFGPNVVHRKCTYL